MLAEQENVGVNNLKYYNPGFKHLPEYIRNKFISKGITGVFRI